VPSRAFSLRSRFQALIIAEVAGCTLAGKAEASIGYALGVDNPILATTGEAAWKSAASVRPPRRPFGPVSDVARSLADDDPVVRARGQARQLTSRRGGRVAVDHHTMLSGESPCSSPAWGFAIGLRNDVRPQDRRSDVLTEADDRSHGVHSCQAHGSTSWHCA
jgi:hypothetical protein